MLGTRAFSFVVERGSDLRGTSLQLALARRKGDSVVKDRGSVDGVVMGLVNLLRAT